MDGQASKEKTIAWTKLVKSSAEDAFASIICALLVVFIYERCGIHEALFHSIGSLNFGEGCLGGLVPGVHLGYLYHRLVYNGERFQVLALTAGLDGLILLGFGALLSAIPLLIPTRLPAFEFYLGVTIASMLGQSIGTVLALRHRTED